MTHKKNIHTVAVIGAGTMGMGIAAHFANKDFEVCLFNRKKEENTNAFIAKKFQKFIKQRPPALYTSNKIDNIKFYNLSDDLPKLTECDLIVESVAENTTLKAELFKNIGDYLSPHCILASNTSGLSINELCQHVPKDIQPNFLGIHFFNPPRYLKLIELIPHKNTNEKTINRLENLAENQLGKRALIATDTPGFIANRIGVFSLLNAVWNMVKFDLTVEEVDMATGELLGRPKSATVRTSDVIGLDTVQKVVDDLHSRLEHDKERETFKLPDFTLKLIERNHLGEKTNFTGNYQKIKDKDGKSTINMLNWKTVEYIPTTKKTPKVYQSLAKETLENRFNKIFEGKDKYSQFLQTHLLETLSYAANTLPEIGNEPIKIDQGLQWGYGWKIGPFGILENIDEKHLKNYPELLKAKTEYKSEEVSNSIETFSKISDIKTVLKSDKTHTVRDLGDGVWGVSIHTKFNTINTKLVKNLHGLIDEINQNPEVKGLAIVNEGPHFSAGFDLSEMLGASKLMAWGKVDKAVAEFQNLNQAIRFSKKPIVAGVFGITLGGGFEIARHCSALVATPESYIGLPEIGVGVVPAGGGCKEMLRRIEPKIFMVPKLSPSPFLQHLGESMGMGKVSSSAYDAVDLGYLEPNDTIICHPDKLLFRVKHTVLSLSINDYQPPKPAKIMLWGDQMRANFMGGVKMFKKGGYISEYDEIITRELVDILCGPFTLPTKVSEQFILDLERAAFIKLLKNKKTRERIKYMLENGKPLRN